MRNLFDAEVDGIEVRCHSIGSIEVGGDGVDYYVRLKPRDQDMTLEQAQRLMTGMYEREPSQPGGVFCRHTRVLQDGDAWIGIAAVRYDI